jgi:protein O-mannosyl-transferase
MRANSSAWSAAEAVAGGRRRAWFRRLLPVAVAMLAALPFLPALNGGFLNWDDAPNFLTNEGFRGLGPTQIRWMLTSTLMGHWIPLTWLTFGINYAIGGLDPFGYHLGNLLLHGVNASLVYLVGRRLLIAGSGTPGNGARPEVTAGAFLAALIFAVHPLRAESVAWITGRRDLLCATFSLATVLIYLRAVCGRSPLRGATQLLVLGSLAAALASKATAMAVPLLLLLMDVYPLRRAGLGWRRLLGEKTGLLALAGLGGLVALWAVHRGATFTPWAAYGADERLAMLGYSLWLYPAAWVWPVGLSPLYELPARVSLLDARFAWPAMGVVALSASLIALRRRVPGVLAAWVCSALVLFPVAGVVHAGFQLAHDRYSYLSGVGLAMLPGAALAWVLRQAAAGRVGRWVAGCALGAAILVAVGLGTAAWRQSAIWHDSETLWRWAVAGDPGCAICRNNLADAIMRSGWQTPARLAEAEAHLRAAIAQRPSYPNPYNLLGTVLAGTGQYQEAEQTFRRLIALAPGLDAGYVQLGRLYLVTERYEDAVPNLRRGLVTPVPPADVRRDLARALAGQAVVLGRSGRGQESNAVLDEAVALAPADPVVQASVQASRAHPPPRLR